jgi:signal transduction histidine kinase
VPHAFTWRADPESWRRRLDLLEQLLACYQQALGHKVRNQLISIGCYTKLLEQDLGDQVPSQVREHLCHVSTLTRETGELVGTLSDLGRLCRDLEPTTLIDLAAAVREAGAAVKVLNPQRSIVYDLQEKMLMVNVPRRPLNLALVTLLRCAGDGDFTALRVTAEATAQEIALHIERAGRGLSADELALLFERLTSGAVAIDRGLDWFLIRQAAALWGGGVSLQSEPGHATIFTLWFANPQLG